MGNIILVSALRRVFELFMNPAFVEELRLLSVEVAPKLLEENYLVLVDTFGGSPEIRLGRPQRCDAPACGLVSRPRGGWRPHNKKTARPAAGFDPSEP